MGAESMRVRDYMTTEVQTVGSDTDIMRAIRLFVDRDLSGMPVVDAFGTLVGMLTERDCIQVALSAGYHDESAGTVADFMSREVETVLPEDSLMDLAAYFVSSPHRRCPVVHEGRLVGMICRRDILRALTEGSWFAAS